VRLQQVDDAAAKHPLVGMWRDIASLPAAEQLYGQIMKLAQIGMELVGASVSDERAFSAMTFVEHFLRSSLTTHLPLCMRMKLQDEYGLSSFLCHSLPLSGDTVLKELSATSGSKNGVWEGGGKFKQDMLIVTSHFHHTIPS
jgi:hypothetical protein